MRLHLGGIGVRHLHGLHGPLWLIFQGLPEDVGKGAVFLASDDAAYVTGLPLTIDGGYTAQ